MNIAKQATTHLPSDVLPSDGAAATVRLTPRRSLRTRLVAVLVASLTAITLGLPGTAQPAEAASGVSACFRTRTSMVIAGQNTFLELYAGGSWHPAAMRNTGRNGCVSFQMWGSWQNLPARIRMQAYPNGDAVGGASRSAPAGSAYYNLGTVYPWCVGICYGF